jgi:hypothetical protein
LGFRLRRAELKSPDKKTGCKNQDPSPAWYSLSGFRAGPVFFKKSRFFKAKLDRCRVMKKEEI